MTFLHVYAYNIDLLNILFRYQLEVVNFYMPDCLIKYLLCTNSSMDLRNVLSAMPYVCSYEQFLCHSKFLFLYIKSFIYNLSINLYIIYT